jgi:hypothetical protein
MSAAPQFVKKVLLPATSTIVARPIYALANNLSKISDKRVQEYVLYDAIAPSFPTTLMYCKRGPEHFIIDIRDTGG